MPLAFLEYGDAANPPLLILHGLFGSGRNWGTIARTLGETWHVYALDLPDHGRSPWSDAPLNYPYMARMVLHFMDSHGLTEAAVIGHSMGGKTAMSMALAAPDRVTALVVVDIAPVAYGRREHLSYIRAMQGIDVASMGRRAEVEAQLTEAIPIDMIRKFLMQNLVTDEATGGLRWQINLDLLADSMTALMDFPIEPDWEPYGEPAFFLAGGASDYLLPEHEAAVRRLFLDSTIERIPGAGHWLHAEAPKVFLDKVGGFLAKSR